MRCRKRRRKNHHYTCLVCFAEFSSNIQYVQHRTQHNEDSTTYCGSDSEVNTIEQDNPIEISSPTSFDETSDAELDPLDISIILENSSEPETIVIDEDPLSPEIITVDKYGEQESLLINSSPEVSNDRPDIVSYDFSCDVCYDIFCTKEELESHMELHSQIEERNTESNKTENISEKSSGNRTESRNKSLPTISENTSPFQEDSMPQVDSPQDDSISNGNIDSFMSNFLRPAVKNSSQTSLDNQSSVVRNFFPDINKISAVLPQEQFNEIPSNNDSNTESQVYYMNAPTISTNQNIVSDADGNMYVLVGCTVANGEIKSVNSAGPISPLYERTTTSNESIHSPNFIMSNSPVSHDNDLRSTSQPVNRKPDINYRPIISLARLNQNIEQMMENNSSALDRAVVPQKSLKKNETKMNEKKVVVVKQKLVRMKNTRNKMSKITEFEIIEESCTPKPPRKKAAKANILRKIAPSEKNVPTDWIPTNSDDSNSFTSRGPLSYVDHLQEGYSHYSNLKNTLLHGSTGVTFERQNQYFSSQTNEDEANIVHIAAEPEIPPPPFQKSRSKAIIDPLPGPVGKAPTVERILMPKITNVMSMNSDIMESDSITVLSDGETESTTQKLINGLNTNCDDDDDDIEKALPMSLIYRPEAEKAGQ